MGLGSPNFLPGKGFDNSSEVLAPVGLQRKAQRNGWCFVGVIALHLVGEEWIDGGLPYLAGAPAQEGAGFVLLSSVGEVDDALLNYGPTLLPVCISTPIPHDSAEVRELGI